jgi:hypothetical protein
MCLNFAEFESNPRHRDATTSVGAAVPRRERGRRVCNRETIEYAELNIIRTSIRSADPIALSSFIAKPFAVAH